MEAENEFIAESNSESETESIVEDEVEALTVEDPNINIKSLDDYFSSPVHPVQEEALDCHICKRTWASTPNHPRTTRICGHTFHTICNTIHEYDNHGDGCSYGCTYHGWTMIQAIRRVTRNTQIEKVDTVIENSMKTKGFHTDLKDLKQCIRKVSSANTSVSKQYKMVKKNIVHKHLHAINYVQQDLNDSLKAVKKGDDMKKLRSSIMIYRRKARIFYQKYRVSLRDLRDRKLVNISYSVGWALERHRSMYSSWRSSIRIYPGKKTWRDPLPNASA